MKLSPRRLSQKTRQRKLARRHRFLRFESLELRQLLAADILGAVYNDVDGDGVHNNGEHGLANWTVFLDLDSNGSPDAGEPSALTDADGKFAFRGVAAGDYRVAEVVRTGWTPTNPTTGYTDVTVTDGQEKTVNFLNEGSGGTGVITGNMWRDLNKDGIKNPEDTGLAGWTVFLDLNSSEVLDPDEPFELTDGNGDYTFTGILGGGVGDAISYEVWQLLPPGWEPSIGGDQNQTAEVLEEQTTLMDDFVNWPDPEKLSGLTGTVWNDTNGNGAQDGAEPGLSGWTVYADLNINNTLDAGEPSTTTNVSGDYSLVSLESGNIRIAEVQHIDFKPTSPSTGYKNVVVPSAGTLENVNFGNQQRTDAAIGGVIYVDRDKDGVRDPGEEGLPGITVYIDVDDSRSLTPGDLSMVTGADHFYTPDVDEAGTYHFDHLAAGTYIVRQIVPAELSSTPESEKEHSVTVGPAEDRSDIDGGDQYRPSEIHGIKFEDVNGNHSHDSGEPGIEGVTIFIDLNRNDMLDTGEPTTLTLTDGSYEFVGLEAGAYVVREVVPAGFVQTFPQTVDGILWPAGVSNPAVGNVTPTLIQVALAQGETHTETVSLTLPTTGALTDMVDVFLLFDDTGSFTSNSPIVHAAFPEIIAQLETRLTGINLGFGVGRLEEYGNFAAEYSTGRPFILNQPIIASDVADFSASIQAALDHVAPGYGGDQPETVIEALYQMVTGAGFDGNDNGSLLDSGPAGPLSTQVNPGNSGDVPSFASFTPDPTNGVLPASGSIGGAGFRSGALPIIITATDTGFAYQPKGESSITGIDGLTLPVSQFTGTSRGTTPFNSGAGIQETVTGLNALGALVIGLGTNDGPSIAPRQGLESLASLTGAINRTTSTIANGTPDAIAPGDPFYFKIGTGGDPLVLNIADGIVAAIDGAVTSVNVNVTLRASDPRVHIAFNPGVINGLGAGDTATFDVTFTGDGRPHRFDLQFIREGTDVVLGSIPVVLGTPISGDGYEFEDCEDGEHSQEIDFGNQRIDGLVVNEVINGGSANRSGVAKFSLDFGQAVTISSATALSVYNHTTGSSADLSAASLQGNGASTVTWDLSSVNLPDGRYTGELPAADATSAGGLPLASTHTSEFFVLRGDVNGDGAINFADYGVVGSNFDPLPGTPYRAGDANGDGLVNFADYGVIGANFNPLGLASLSYDLGDAPETGTSYPTTVANDGARHLLGTGLFLGAGVDVEADGQPHANALGDDNAGDDEDGVTFGNLNAGSNANITVVAAVPSSAVLNAWVDFNADGDWSDFGEQIFTNKPLADGSNALSFSIPAAAAVGDTFARFRVTTSAGYSFTGMAPDGEVEDYLFTILDGAAGAALEIKLPSSAVQAVVVGNEIVVRAGATEFFRAPGEAREAVDMLFGQWSAANSPSDAENTSTWKRNEQPNLDTELPPGRSTSSSQRHRHAFPSRERAMVIDNHESLDDYLDSLDILLAEEETWLPRSAKGSQTSTGRSTDPSALHEDASSGRCPAVFADGKVYCHPATPSR